MIAIEHACTSLNHCVSPLATIQETVTPNISPVATSNSVRKHRTAPTEIAPGNFHPSSLLLLLLLLFLLHFLFLFFFLHFYFLRYLFFHIFSFLISLYLLLFYYSFVYFSSFIISVPPSLVSLVSTALFSFISLFSSSISFHSISYPSFLVSSSYINYSFSIPISFCSLYCFIFLPFFFRCCRCYSFLSPFSVSIAPLPFPLFLFFRLFRPLFFCLYSSLSSSSYCCPFSSKISGFYTAWCHRIIQIEAFRRKPHPFGMHSFPPLALRLQWNPMYPTPLGTNDTCDRTLLIPATSITDVIVFTDVNKIFKSFNNACNKPIKICQVFEHICLAQHCNKQQNLIQSDTNQIYFFSISSEEEEFFSINGVPSRFLWKNRSYRDTMRQCA